MRTLTTELFRAFRGEFAVFSPLPGCFEHFGLDFMVDEDFQVWLLEANPGPDFKQVCARHDELRESTFPGFDKIIRANWSSGERRSRGNVTQDVR
ncbi:unnamed protein product [Pylaiella littoralis]